MKLLIFDIDGTLTDTNEVDTECYTNAFQDEFGVELTSTDWSTFQNVTDLGVFVELFARNFSKKPKLTELKNFQARFFDNLEENLLTRPERFAEIRGAKRFVDYCLNQVDFKIAFAIGGWSKSAKLKLTLADISYSNLPLSTSDLLISRREILSDAIENSSNGVNFAEIVYFGDGVWDYHTTAQLGIRFIGVDATNDGKLKKLGATEVIEDFSDLKNVVKLLNEPE